MTMIITLLPLLALLVAPVQAQEYCRDRFNRVYRCDRGGLSYGARIGIGIGVAAGVLLLFSLCGFWRRRQIRNQFAKYKTPNLPFHQNNQHPSGPNPYANNPPPPTGANATNWSSNPYGSNPPPPAQTYQPGTAGQYKAGRGDGETEHEHGYEWQQAREAERLEREGGGAGGETAPPGYDVAASQANATNHTGYAPPPGAPPGSKETPIVKNL